jgi:hypothetical protein
MKKIILIFVIGFITSSLALAGDKFKSKDIKGFKKINISMPKKDEKLKNK